jgi:hypothetical protein
MRFILASIVAEVLPYVVCFFVDVAGLFFKSFYIAGFVLLLGGCPRIEAVARESCFESDFSII